jgi:hypothetical protein
VTRRDRTARQTYEARSADILRLVGALPQLLAKHEAKMERDALNWGHAGDLQEVRNKLIGAVAILANMPIVDVEESLGMRVGVRVDVTKGGAL